MWLEWSEQEGQWEEVRGQEGDRQVAGGFESLGEDFGFHLGEVQATENLDRSQQTLRAHTD